MNEYMREIQIYILALIDDDGHILRLAADAAAASATDQPTLRVHSHVHHFHDELVVDGDGANGEKRESLNLVTRLMNEGACVLEGE